MRLPKVAGVLMTDSREGLFLIRLVGFKSSLQLDNLSGGSEECMGRQAGRHMRTLRLNRGQVIKCEKVGWAASEIRSAG